MSSSRNTFAATRRSHRILERLREGETVEIEDVTDAFDVQYPQARADLKLLEELYDLSTHRDGRIKVWTWETAEDAEYADVAVAASLELGAIALDIFEGTPYGEAIDQLADGCRDRVRDAHRDRIERLSEGLHLRRTWLPVASDRMVDHVEEVLDALGLRQWLRGEYCRADGESGTYVVLPRCLVWYQARLWMLALHGRSLKLFDVAGFEDLERLRGVDPEAHDAASLGGESAARDDDRATSEGEGGTDADGSGPTDAPLPAAMGDDDLESFLDDLDDDPSSYFEGAFGIYAQNYSVEEVELEVHGEWANYLGRYRLHPSQTNEELDEGLRVRFEVGLCPEFKSFVLGMIPDVEICRPESLREELHLRVEEWVGGR